MPTTSSRWTVRHPSTASIHTCGCAVRCAMLTSARVDPALSSHRFCCLSSLLYRCVQRGASAAASASAAAARVRAVERARGCGACVCGAVRSSDVLGPRGPPHSRLGLARRVVPFRVMMYFFGCRDVIRGQSALHSSQFVHQSAPHLSCTSTTSGMAISITTWGGIRAVYR